MAFDPGIPFDERTRLRALNDEAYGTPNAQIRAETTLAFNYELIEALYTIQRSATIHTPDEPIDPTAGDIWLDAAGLVHKWDGSSWIFIADLKGTTGPQGPAGANGEDGQDGATGAQGPAGATGAQGAAGADGADGTRIYTGVGEPELDTPGAANDLFFQLVSANQYKLWKHRTLVSVGQNPWQLLFTSPLGGGDDNPGGSALSFQNNGTGVGVFRDVTDSIVNFRKFRSANSDTLVIYVDAVTGDIIFEVVGGGGGVGADGKGYGGAASDSRSITTGDVSWSVLPLRLAYQPLASRVRVAADALNYMEGVCTAYDPATGAMTVNVDRVAGAGTFSAWYLSLAGDRGAAGATGATGTAGANGASAFVYVAYAVTVAGSSATGFTLTPTGIEP